MIYLKTYFYSEHEVPFLTLHLLEAYPYIDKFIICEYNYTHTGLKRKYIWNDIKHQLPQDKLDKVLYIQGDMSHIVKYAYNDGRTIHTINEPWMRGYFVKEIELQDNDIIFSVDADEIIYGEMYPELIECVKNMGIVRLPMNQFFYRVNYLWKDLIFRSSIVALYKVYKNSFPAQWRDAGQNYSKIVGCHFSWCMTVEQMLYKMECYSHPEYRHLAKEEILEDAIENKKYPFAPNRPFTLLTIDFDTDKRIPKKMLENKKEFKHLIQ
tara:strand:- start:509 stop:1309 length:801 start_codon:yes stop_codon:yes gene_type:complete